MLFSDTCSRSVITKHAAYLRAYLAVRIETHLLVSQVDALRSPYRMLHYVLHDVDGGGQVRMPLLARARRLLTNNCGIVRPLLFGMTHSILLLLFVAYLDVRKHASGSAGIVPYQAGRRRFICGVARHPLRQYSPSTSIGPSTRQRNTGLKKFQLLPRFRVEDVQQLSE